MIQDEHGMWKDEFFYYNGQKYGAGTEFWFTGLCYVKGEVVLLKDEKCVFRYIRPGSSAVFSVNGEEAWCSTLEFTKHICLEHERAITEIQEEWYLSKESFNKLLIYVIVMVVGVIFYDRWLIWIGATIIFVATTPEIRQFFKRRK